MFGSKHRAEKRAAEVAASRASHQAELRDDIIKLIALASGEDSTDSDWPLMLRSGERLASQISGAGLFEPRREPGHWSGRSAGVSVPVPDTRLRVRVGKSAGTYVQGDEVPTVIDQGNASITTERVVFQGDKYTREWDFSKLIGVIHYSDHPATAIQVSNRQKTSGIVYPGEFNTEPIRLAMTVAIAIFRGEAKETIQELRDELAKLDPPAPTTQSEPPDSDSEPTPKAMESPAATSPAPTAEQTLPEAKWAADPTGRHQWRYWDGKVWTDYVGDDGRETRDPMTSSPP
jgi:hypothetical protein